MARVANENSTSYGTVNQVARTQSVSLSFYISSNEGSDDSERMRTRWGYSSNPSGNEFDHGWQYGTPPGTFWGGRNISPTADTTFYWKVIGNFIGTGSTQVDSAGTTARKTWAVDPTVGNPTLSGETSSSVDVDFSWTPGTNESAVDAIVQYRELGGTFTDWTSISDEDQTGYTSRSSPGDFSTTTITGLSAETTYEFRIKVDRSTTRNSTTVYYSDVVSTATIADTPSVTTDAATGVTSSGATLNATVDHNTVDGNLSWRYHTSQPSDPNDTIGTEVSYASNPVTGDGSYSKSISGLSESTEYYFWAIYEDTSTSEKYYGNILNFTTPASPGTEAAAEEHTVYIEDYGKRKTAKTVIFPLYSVGGSSADRFVTDPSPFGSAAYWVSKDGAAPASATNSPSQVSAGKGLYSLALSTGEMDANFVDVIITDGGTNFRDVHLHILTEVNLGNVDIDASQGSNLTALKLTGSGSGHGLEAIGGATGNDIDGVISEMVALKGTAQSSASSTTIKLESGIATTANDDLNGSIILLYAGAGAGQARVITDYTHHATDPVATVHKAWENYASDPPDNTTQYYILGSNHMLGVVGDTTAGTSPGDELDELPYYTSYYADMLQYIFQRVAYKRTETAAVHKMFEDDESTEFAQYGVQDTGDTETKEKAEDV